MYEGDLLEAQYVICFTSCPYHCLVTKLFTPPNGILLVAVAGEISTGLAQSNGSIGFTFHIMCIMSTPSLQSTPVPKIVSSVGVTVIKI